MTQQQFANKMALIARNCGFRVTQATGGFYLLAKEDRVVYAFLSVGGRFGALKESWKATISRCPGEMYVWKPSQLKSILAALMFGPTDRQDMCNYLSLFTEEEQGYIDTIVAERAARKGLQQCKGLTYLPIQETPPTGGDAA